MADTIKIGNLEIDNLKVGTLSVDALYIGDVKIYPSTPPPTPTLQWVSYSEGDTVPSSTIYGVKLYMDNPYSWAIDFGFDSGISFSYDGNDWIAFDIETFEQIDISSYYDVDENYYTILFSDLGYGGLTIYSPEPEVDTFNYDIDFYQE